MPLGAPMRQLDGFVTIEQALAHSKDSKDSRVPVVNVIGVVSEILPTKPSRGSGRRQFARIDAPADHAADLQFAVQLQDHSVTAKLGEGQDVRARWFIKPEEQAPKIETVGDTVILRNECIVFPSNAMPDPHFNDSYASGQMLHYSAMPQSAKPPTPEQQVWAISLHHTLCSNSTLKSGSVVNVPSRQPTDKFGLIKSVGPRQFFDLVVEVVKIYPLASEIYVTDYTENNLLYGYKHPDEDLDTSRDGDAYDYTGLNRRKAWPGPFGQMTLQVKLWGPHATAFDKIGEGEIVELKNVHIKMDRSGTHLEGALHEDRHYPHRVNVVSMQNKYRDPRVYELERRKETHMMAVRSREQRGMVKQSRKKNRKEKRAMGKKEKQAAAQTEDPASDSDYSGLNPHGNGVECELPFVNAMYKSRVRVVDFWPENLEDFSKSLDNPEFNDVHEEDQTQSSTTYTALSTGTQRWEWHFCLLVEDAKHPPGAKSPVRIPLLVFDKDAECLLCLDATE
ncbi:hypothetical protein SLS54_009196 [Diplodia seriata]